MPVDAETMHIDYSVLSSADGDLSPDAVLAMAVYDESGHVSWAEILPSGMSFLPMDLPTDDYGYASTWHTASFNLTGMDPEVFFVSALDTEALSGIAMGAALDNVRTVGWVIPEPCSLPICSIAVLVVLSQRTRESAAPPIAARLPSRRTKCKTDNIAMD